MSREISRKIDEVAVFGFLDRAAATRADDPFTGRATSSHGVDDQISTNLFARCRAHPGDVRYTGDGRCTRDQFANLGPPTDSHVRCDLRHRSHRPFNDRPPTGDATHGFIARTRHPVRYGWGKILTIEMIHPNATGAKQVIRQPWQFAIADHPKSRMETMGLPELGNSGAFHKCPPLDGGPRLTCWVSLQDRDAVTVATKHGRCA